MAHELGRCGTLYGFLAGEISICMHVKLHYGFGCFACSPKPREYENDLDLSNGGGIDILYIGGGVG